MQVGHCFFDGPRGSEHGSRSQESFKSLQMILRPEGTMPLTYPKRIAIGPVAKKLSQFKEWIFLEGHGKALILIAPKAQFQSE